MQRQGFDPLRFTRPEAPTEEERHRMITEAAYYLAESRHFAPGHELEDWLLAEAQVEQLLKSARPA